MLQHSSVDFDKPLIAINLMVLLAGRFDFGISSVLNCIGDKKKLVARINYLYCEHTNIISTVTYCDKRSGMGGTGGYGIIGFCILRSIAAHPRCVTGEGAQLLFDYGTVRRKWGGRVWEVEEWGYETFEA